MKVTEGFLALTWPERALFILLSLECIGICGVFPYHAFTQWPDPGLKIFAVLLAAFALLTLYGVWQRKSWMPWAAFVVIASKLTIDLFAWSTGLDRMGTPVSALVLLVMAYLVFRIGEPRTPKLTPYQRALYLFVALFAGWVGAGGLLYPNASELFLPFSVPPLHARFIGAMYIAGSVNMALSALRSDWREVRASTLILFLWTGILAIVSLIYADAFDWTWRPTWFWWVAYIWFPMGALFLLINKRHEIVPAAAPRLATTLRTYLSLQGGASILLGLLLLLAPGLAVDIWPWSITPLLAQVYSAPFLAYGAGSLYAARLNGWSEVRIPVLATLTFALVAVLASFLHSGLFDAANISTWIWFSGFGGASLSLAAFALLNTLNTSANA